MTKILELHRKWLFNIDGGIRADLRSADLRSADLRSADLSFANLSSANLRSANLRSANLSFADLSSANLSSANLRSANLSFADLSSANLRSANLRSADLSSAKTKKRYIQVACIGSRKDMTTYCFEDDLVFCGCFKGTLKEFKQKCLKTYPDKKSQNHKEYLGFIEYLENLKD